MGNGLDRFRIIVASIIVGAWLATLIYGAIQPAYAPRTEISVLMIAVATFLFAPKIGRHKNGDE